MALAVFVKFLLPKKKKSANINLKEENNMNNQIIICNLVAKFLALQIILQIKLKDQKDHLSLKIKIRIEIIKGKTTKITTRRKVYWQNLEN